MIHSNDTPLEVITCFEYFSYADVLASKLNQKNQGIEKSKATRQLLVQKIETYKAELEKAKKEIVKMGETTTELVTKVKTVYTAQIMIIYNILFCIQVESDLSHRYNGRVVTLYGGVKFDTD